MTKNKAARKIETNAPYPEKKIPSSYEEGEALVEFAFTVEEHYY